MAAILFLLNAILDIYWWIVIGYVIISWLFAFGIVNSSNQFVNAVSRFLYDATEPVLSRVRRFMPNLGTVDLSPIVVLLGITFLQILLNQTIAPALYRSFV